MTTKATALANLTKANDARIPALVNAVPFAPVEGAKVIRRSGFGKHADLWTREMRNLGVISEAWCSDLDEPGSDDVIGMLDAGYRFDQATGGWYPVSAR